MNKQNSQPQAIKLTDYQPPVYLVDEVRLTFDLDPLATRVSNEMQIRRNPDSEADTVLRLDGEHQKLISVQLNGVILKPQDYRLENGELAIPVTDDAFVVQLETEISPQQNTALEGLYLSSGNFCTQCEAEGFRRITFFPDRPDVMARFRTRIIADEQDYPVLLSNGNPVASGQSEPGRHWVEWEDPYPKPSYLFALVAGRLAVLEDQYVTQSGRNVDLRIYVEPHNLDKCDHAMRSLKRAMRWDEETFGLEYDLDIYMIVAVDDFNMGAMENKGLNVFNSKFVLARPDTATDDDYVNIEAVIAHEYFHNWTGNRVTCRDWFQLSLKEGLTVFRDQQFTADMTSAPVKRIHDVRMLRTHQFAEDASPMAHPVRPQSYIEINNFYTVTVYEKGAEVVRMYQTLLGKDGFRKGMGLYFQRHDGEAVTTDDFRAAMADANDYDLRQFQRWYDQAGTPVLHVSEAFDQESQVFSLTFTQSCPATPGQDEKVPFLMPVKLALLDSEGQSLPLKLSGSQSPAVDEMTLVLTEQEQTFEFTNIPERPLPSLLRGFSAPVSLEYDYSGDELAFLMAKDSDLFNRWAAGQRLAMQTLLSLSDDIAQGKSLAVPDYLQRAVAGLLSSAEVDPALVAEALVLPSESYIADQMAVVDVDAIHAAREFMRAAIAREHEQAFNDLYQRYGNQAEYQLDAQSMGRRRLANVCLSYLVSLGVEKYIEVALAQALDASNMTDTMGAMGALNQRRSQQRSQALQAFHDRWIEDSLVMDKWFSLQAMLVGSGVIDDVLALMQHPLFSIKNPNKVRALIGAFVQGNPTAFHDPTGSGYGFLADRVLELDTINPQVAARMVKQLGRWRRFDKQRQSLMQKELNRILQKQDLSRDVFEIVSKSLEAA
jgi:aminopeptidase N